MFKIAKKNKKRKKPTFVGEDGFFNRNGYVEYDGYIKVGKNKYKCIFDVLFKYGTNNPAPIGWTTDLIPRNPLRHGDIYFVQREKGTPKRVENEILGKGLNAKVVTMGNDGEDRDFRAQSKKELEINDIGLTKKLAKNETIVDSDMQLIVTAKTPEDIEETVKELKQNYKDMAVEGVLLVRQTARQKEMLINILDSISADSWHNSDMLTVAGSRLFMPSSGFSDPQGVFVGLDRRSFLGENRTFIDFSGCKNGIIHTGRIPAYVSIGGLEGGGSVSKGGSAWAHVIAERNYLSDGRRTHHINLVPFAYQATNSLYFDMKEFSINTLEVFGTPNTVQEDANDNFDKITEQIMMMINPDKQDLAIKGNLRALLVDWVIKKAGGNGIYTADPKNDQLRAERILATNNHQNYPTIQDFLTALQTNVATKSNVGERAVEKAEILYNTVLTASRTYPSIFNAKTNIPDKFNFQDRNIYYDVSKVSKNKVIKGAVFLNVLAYVVNRCHEDDVIVIHGLDSIDINPDILKQYRERIDEKNVGLISTFEDMNNKRMNVKTLIDFVKPLNNQDIIVLGGVTVDSLQAIEYSWQRSLPEVVKSDLLENVPNQFYVYRKRDHIGAVVDSHLIL